MTDQETINQRSEQAMKSLAVIQQLTFEAGLSESKQQLIFRILNRSILLCRYDRAVLWSINAGRFKLLGVSGSGTINRQSPLAQQWHELITQIGGPDKPTIISDANFSDKQEQWQALADQTGGLSVLWMPIKIAEKTVACLWLERWGSTQTWSDSELKQMDTLALAYGIAWRGCCGGESLRTRLTGSRGRRLMLVASVIVLLILLLVKIPLRIVAPCEVVADNPVVVTAPLEGVIDQVVVDPGRQVNAGELLASYDKQVAKEQLQVAQQQVRIIEAQLQRSRVHAFDDEQVRAQVSALENRLKQEQVRLNLAQYRVSQLDITSPVDGTVMLDDPDQWRGRPVVIGQRILQIVDPTNTKVNIWLPLDDNIQFDRDRSVRVVLNSDPGMSRRGELVYVAMQSRINPHGVPSFLAEVRWDQPPHDLKIGLQGSAVLYGKPVRLAFWLIRRPWAFVRRITGF